MANWKLAMVKETVMCGYDIQGCQNHMDIYVGEHTNEPCEDCGDTEDCYKVMYVSPSLELGYIWKGTTYSEDGEYTFYPTLEQARDCLE